MPVSSGSGWQAGFGLVGGLGFAREASVRLDAAFGAGFARAFGLA
jgi:hypothetical protein